MRYRSWITTIVFFQCFAFASQAKVFSWLAPSQEPAVSLFVKPVTCQVKQFGEFCEFTILATANSTRREKLCLFQSGDERSLWCGLLTKNPKLLIKDKADKNQNYYLSDGKQVLASTQFQVAVYQHINQRKRRRYGLGL